MFKGAKGLMRRDREELNQILEKLDFKRRAKAQGESRSKKSGHNMTFAYTSRKAPKPAIDDLLGSLKLKTGSSGLKRSSSANKYLSKLGNIIKT
jgi:hypothetical protein